MTVEEMRTELDLGPEISAVDVVAAWVAAQQAAPPPELISLADAKAHLRITSSREDAVIQGMLDAAIATLDGPEGWLGRSLYQVTRTARVWCSGRRVRLPYPPIVSVVSLEARASATWEVLAESAWQFEDDVLELASSPTGLREHRVIYTAGYTELPKPLRAAILLMVGDLFANRATTVPTANASKVPMSTTVETLLSTYRVFA